MHALELFTLPNNATESEGRYATCYCSTMPHCLVWEALVDEKDNYIIIVCAFAIFFRQNQAAHNAMKKSTKGDIYGDNDSMVQQTMQNCIPRFNLHEQSIDSHDPPAKSKISDG